MDVAVRRSVDLIVVNYKTPDDLERFLLSLHHLPFTYNLYVANVESGAKDRHISSQFHPHYQIDFEENVGYAGAVNHCVSRGAAPLIGIFNADVEFKSSSGLDRLVEQFRASASWGVVAPRQVDNAGRITHAGIFGTNTDPKHRGWKVPDKGQFTDIRTDAVTLSGSALFTRRSAWNEMLTCRQYSEYFPDVEGAFLPTPHYYEETGYIYHLRAHGYQAVYFGPSEVKHLWHRSSQIGGWAERQMPVSREIFRGFCKHHNIPCD